MDAQALVDKFMAEQAPQPDAQPDAQALVDKFMAKQALPPPPPEPSLGGFLSGLGSMVTSSFGSDPKFDVLNRALGGSIQTSTDATRRAADNLTPDQRASLEEYSAPALITAASMLVPGGMAAQAATNIVANALVHGEKAYREGDNVLSAMNPLNHPVETAIGAFAPAAVTSAAALLRGLRSTGSSAGNALKQVWAESSGMVDSARRLVPGGPPEGPARLGLEEALRLDAPLRPLPSYPKAATVADDAAEAGAEFAVPDTAWRDLSGRDKLAAAVERAQGERSWWGDNVAKARPLVSRPARYLSRVEGPAGKSAGFRLEDVTHTEQRLRENGLRLIKEHLGDLDAVQRTEVTSVLNGTLLPGDAAPKVARAAAGMTDFYKQWANLAQREGLLTKDFIEEQAEPIFRGFKPIPKNYSPLIRVEDNINMSLRDRLRGLYKKDTVSHARRPMGQGDDEVEYLTDALDIAKTYTDDYAKKIAIARTFGSESGRTLNAGKPWGKQAMEIYDAIRQEADPIAPEMFKETMDRLYTGQQTAGQQAVGDINARITSSLLGGSWATQLGQAASPIWRYGLENTMEGIGRYLRDPDLRAIINASGVRDSGYASYLAGGNDSLSSLPIRAIGGVERVLRGPANAGVVPYLEKLADEVAGGRSNSAVAKQLQELMLTPQRLAGGSAGLDWDTLKDAIQASGRRAQFHAGMIGQTGNAFLDPGVAKTAVSLQPFGWSAWTAAQDDILEPLFSKHDSLARLGMGRLTRMIPAALGAEALRELVTSGVRLQTPNWREVLANAAGTQFGTPGQILGGQLALESNVDPRFSLTPPIVSVLSGLEKDVTHGDWGSAALNAAAFLDPTGYAAMARPTIRGLMR